MSEMNPMPNNVQSNAGVKSQGKTTFSDELKIVPWWAYLLGVCGFASMPFLIHYVVTHDPHPPSAIVRMCVGLLSGVLLGCFFLLVGYVNADARRRGMNSWLWTALVFFVPNAFGFIIYFLVRQPMQSTCPHCGATLQPHFRFCPKCATPRVALCGHCSAPVQPGDQFCNNCGRMLAEPLK